MCGNAANIAARLEQAGKIYGLSPLISGDVYKFENSLFTALNCIRAVKHVYLCAWLDSVVLHGYNKRVTQVFHLMAPHEEATEEQQKIASTFKSLRKLLLKKEFSNAAEILAECENDPLFHLYKQTMALLEEHCIQESFNQRKAPRGASAGSTNTTNSNMLSVTSAATSRASSAVYSVQSGASGYSYNLESHSAVFSVASGISSVAGSAQNLQNM